MKSISKIISEYAQWYLRQPHYTMQRDLSIEISSNKPLRFEFVHDTIISKSFSKSRNIDDSYELGQTVDHIFTDSLSGMKKGNEIYDRDTLKYHFLTGSTKILYSAIDAKGRRVQPKIVFEGAGMKSVYPPGSKYGVEKGDIPINAKITYNNLPIKILSGFYIVHSNLGEGRFSENSIMEFYNSQFLYDGESWKKK